MEDGVTILVGKLALKHVVVELRREHEVVLIHLQQMEGSLVLDQKKRPGFAIDSHALVRC